MVVVVDVAAAVAAAFVVNADAFVVVGIIIRMV